MVYMGMRGQKVQVSLTHITAIIITRTVRHYQITTGVPLSCFMSGSCLAIQTFHHMITYIIQQHICGMNIRAEQIQKEHLHLFMVNIQYKCSGTGWRHVTVFCLVLNIPGVKFSGDCGRKSETSALEPPHTDFNAA